jgi:hypothetical protein
MRRAFILVIALAQLASACGGSSSEPDAAVVSADGGNGLPDSSLPCSVSAGPGATLLLDVGPDTYSAAVGSSAAEFFVAVGWNGDGVYDHVALPRDRAGCPSSLELPEPMTRINAVVAHSDGSVFFGLGSSNLSSQAVYRRPAPGQPLTFHTSSLYENGNPIPLEEVFGDDDDLFALRSPHDIVRLESGSADLLFDVQPFTIGAAKPTGWLVEEDKLIALTEAKRADRWSPESPIPSQPLLVHQYAFAHVAVDGQDYYFTTNSGAHGTLERVTVGTNLTNAGSGEAIGSQDVVSARFNRARRDFVITANSSADPALVSLVRLKLDGTTEELSTLRFRSCPILEDSAALCLDPTGRWLEIAF